MMNWIGRCGDRLRLAILEAMKAGTTTFNDFFGNMADLARNHVSMGTRAIVTEMINEMLKKLTDNKTGLYAFDPVVGEEKFNRALALYDAFEGAENGRITVGFGVQAMDMLSTELLCRMYREARSRNKKFMLHLEQGRPGDRPDAAPLRQTLHRISGRTRDAG